MAESAVLFTNVRILDGSSAAGSTTRVLLSATDGKLLWTSAPGGRPYDTTYSCPVVAVIDGQRMGFSRFGMYMLLFHCVATGGELRAHPLETSDVGWFAAGELPEATAGAQWWGYICRRGERDIPADTEHFSSGLDSIRPEVPPASRRRPA